SHDSLPGVNYFQVVSEKLKELISIGGTVMIERTFAWMSKEKVPALFLESIIATLVNKIKTETFLDAQKVEAIYFVKEALFMQDLPTQSQRDLIYWLIQISHGSSKQEVYLRWSLGYGLEYVYNGDFDFPVQYFLVLMALNGNAHNTEAFNDYFLNFLKKCTLGNTVKDYPVHICKQITDKKAILDLIIANTNLEPTVREQAQAILQQL
ncbi:MAG: hypothetical protein KDD40_07800, partial [Bdellovibrionales bacterium]|nr:hypothetical protein [Bdellovibrionales bacterium]